MKTILTLLLFLSIGIYAQGQLVVGGITSIDSLSIDGSSWQTEMTYATYDSIIIIGDIAYKGQWIKHINQSKENNVMFAILVAFLGAVFTSMLFSHWFFKRK